MDELIDKEVSMGLIKGTSMIMIMGNGYPIRAYVRAVSLPMVKLQSFWGGDQVWINAGLIEWIRQADSPAEQDDAE